MDFEKPTSTTKSNSNAIKLDFKFGLVVTNIGIAKHEINKDGILMDGVWLDDIATISTLENIMNHAKASVAQDNQKVELLPDNVIYEDNYCLAWYTKNQRIHHQWYLYGQQMLHNVPHPRILFVAAKHQRYMGVAAIPSSSSERPDKDTPIFHLPVGNVYSDMHMCIGNATFPEEVNYSTMNVIEDVIFQSQYTGFKFQSMTTGDNLENFKMLQNKPEFPDELLKSAPDVASNVGEYIQVIKNRLAK